MTPVEQAVRGAIEQRGPLPFAEVVDRALYSDEGGFYATGVRAGRRGDFITSPEVGPLFGAVMARALDAWWADAGRPDRWTVVEVGAGPGTLARAVVNAAPHCATALRYVLVERSAAQRDLHEQHLPLAPLAALARPPSPDRTGPIIVSTADVPAVPGPCVVLANELLDNLPFGLLERTEEGWAEVRVAVEDDRLVEVLSPTTGPAIDGRVGARVPVQDAAATWVQSARALAGVGGRVLAFDYASTTGNLAIRPWREWVRTYRGHGRGGAPLEALGTQDITCEVATDQLPPPVSDVSQTDWLRAYGLDELVDDAGRAWRARAAIGDLEAMRARSRVHEGDALVDPAGLGAFRVLEWRDEAPAAKPYSRNIPRRGSSV